MHSLQYFRGQLNQLAILNQKGSAIVGFVLAIPLVLLVALSGMQLAWLLIMQAQIEQVVISVAREATLIRPTALDSYVELKVRALPFQFKDYEFKVFTLEDQKIPLQQINIEVPVKIWIGREINLRGIAYVP